MAAVSFLLINEWWNSEEQRMQTLRLLNHWDTLNRSGWERLHCYVSEYSISKFSFRTKNWERKRSQVLNILKSKIIIYFWMGLASSRRSGVESYIWGPTAAKLCLQSRNKLSNSWLSMSRGERFENYWHDDRNWSIRRESFWDSTIQIGWSWTSVIMYIPEPPRESSATSEWSTLQ